VTIIGLGLLGIVGLGALAPSAASAPASVAPEPAPVAVSLSADQKPAGLGCWVTGDMIWSPEGGEGNPATFGRSVCGDR
jgi:hypothetical protein